MADIPQIHCLEIIFLTFLKPETISKEMSKRTGGKPLDPGNAVLKLFSVQPPGRLFRQRV